MIYLKPITSESDPRMYRRNRGGITVIINNKPILHLHDIEYFSTAMEIMTNYKLLMYYLKQRKGASFSCTPNSQLYKELSFFEKFTLAT